MTFRQSTIKYVKDILRARTIYEVIAKELQEAHLRKLEAETAAEYAGEALHGVQANGVSVKPKSAV